MGERSGNDLLSFIPPPLCLLASLCCHRPRFVKKLEDHLFLTYNWNKEVVPAEVVMAPNKSRLTVKAVKDSGVEMSLLRRYEISRYNQDLSKAASGIDEVELPAVDFFCKWDDSPTEVAHKLVRWGGLVSLLLLVGQLHTHTRTHKHKHTRAPACLPFCLPLCCAG